MVEISWSWFPEKTNNTLKQFTESDNGEKKMNILYAILEYFWPDFIHIIAEKVLYSHCVLHLFSHHWSSLDYELWRLIIIFFHLFMFSQITTAYYKLQYWTNHYEF